MSENQSPDKLTLMTAESILQAIYGDDLIGCNIRAEMIAAIISETMKSRDLQTREIIHLYEKVVEAVQVLSTPPSADQVKTPDKLNALLSDRLDKINTIAKKTVETTASLKAQ